NAGATRDDVVIEAPAATPVREILTHLRALVGARADAPASIGGVSIDGALAQRPLGETALRNGAIVLLEPESCVSSQPTSGHPRLLDAPMPSHLELRVVGGPVAGTVYPVAMGTTSLGRFRGPGISLDDPAVSRHHAMLTVSADAVTISDVGSTNGTMLDGVPVGSRPVPVRPGMRLRLGESTLLVTAPDEPFVAITSTTDGRLAFNRPPRLDAPDPDAAHRAVAFPTEPVDRSPNRLPLVATLAPLIAGVALAAVMRRPEYLLFTVLSPLMMASQWVADRLGHRKSKRAEQVAYEVALAKAESASVDALSADARERRSRAPDPVALLSAVGADRQHPHTPRSQGAPSARLWERRSADADFLVVSVGLGTDRASVDVSGTRFGIPMPPPSVSDVPVTVSLPAIGILGIAGAPHATASLARAIVGQIAVLHSPRDVGLVVLAEPSRANTWEWVRWLPHLQPVSGANCQTLLGLDAQSAASRVAELLALIEYRSDNSMTSASPRAIVVLVEGAQALRRTPALAQLLAHGPSVGVYAICVDSDERRLPEECGAVVRFDDPVSSRLHLTVSGAPPIIDVVGDGVSITWAENLARALSPICDDSPDRSGGLPDSVRWLDIAGIADITADLPARWRAPGTGTTQALIGAGPNGRFVIDIARDGPHALIAGTTGSGKSELLQTFVASLALANRPDEMTFVLVDYKGGAAFGACATLPHTVGMVTDLDGRLVERALTSLGAELKRREGVLAAAGAVDIARFRADGGVLARLVIVVDEFASLAEELPSFVGGLVAIAQRGRSLGVHLVLATQRPEGVVSADIRANANLRICLAVMRDAESRDVIDTPNAARISRTTPGRGYARTGHGELVAFQTGRVGGTSARDDGEIDVRLSPFRALCQPAARQSRARGVNESAETDLDCIVTACRDAACHLGITSAPSPWLPPLPEVIPLTAGLTADDRRPLTAVLGVLDVPSLQARQNYVVDLAVLGHLVIAGSARSGRTTALRTLAGGLAKSTPSDQLHLYAVDCSGGSLGALTVLPQCGAVVSNHEPARVLRLFSTLTAELHRRQAEIAPLAQAGPTRPHIVLLIDGWEAFLAAFEDLDAGAIVDGCTRLLREGAAADIHVIATADRAGLVGRLASTVENRLVLRLADRADFSLIGLPARSVPLALPPGRGFVVDGLVEMQICALGRDPSGPAQVAELDAIAHECRTRDTTVASARRPRRIDPLPTVIARTEIESESRRPLPPPGSPRVTLGVGGDELTAVYVDLLDTGPGFLVAGPHRSGRTTALATIADGARASGWHVVAVTPRSSALRDHADDVFDAGGVGLAEALARVDGRLAVLVDDAELIADSPVASDLDRLMRVARDGGHIVVIAGSTDEMSIGFRGFLVDARRARSGILLHPRGPLDGEVLGVRLPRNSGGAAPPGRGLLVVRGSITHMQVAMPDPRPDPRPDPPRRRRQTQPQTVTDRVPIAAPPCATVTLTTPSWAPLK
ncbi:MAG TPA: FtsK/SpoIIIE domain-containing protein, partial [Acidothermaceae bacterium]